MKEREVLQREKGECMKLIRLLERLGWSYEIKDNHTLYFIDCNREVYVDLNSEEQVNNIYADLVWSTGISID